jgi:hypothetical protein
VIGGSPDGRLRTPPDNIFPFPSAGTLPPAPSGGEFVTSFDAVDLIFNAIKSMNLADFVRLQTRLNDFLDGKDV